MSTYYNKSYSNSKYSNTKIKYNGMTFDSKHEYERWCQLKLLERAGDIVNLTRQTKFILIPTQRDKSGKLLEKECAYYADFVYFDTRTKQMIVEDAKGFKTDTYKLKKKLMLYVHNVSIREV